MQLEFFKHSFPSTYTELKMLSLSRVLTHKSHRTVPSKEGKTVYYAFLSLQDIVSAIQDYFISTTT